MNFKHIVLTCGYVEDSRVSCIVFSTEHDDIKSPKDAVTELALDMYAKYKSERERSSPVLKKCCKKQDRSKDKFCSNCGMSLDAGGFDESDFMDMICSLHDATADSYGEDEYAEERDFIWSPWASAGSIFANNGKDVVCIDQCAEEVLLFALLEVKPELGKASDFGLRISAESEWKKIKEGKKK